MLSVVQQHREIFEIFHEILHHYIGFWTDLDCLPQITDSSVKSLHLFLIYSVQYYYLFGGQCHRGIPRTSLHLIDIMNNIHDVYATSTGWAN